MLTAACGVDSFVLGVVHGVWSGQIKQELPWSRYLKAPKRRSKKIPKLKLATALLLMYDCFEKKIVADATSDRVQALVRYASVGIGVWGGGAAALDALTCG